MRCYLCWWLSLSERLEQSVQEPTQTSRRLVDRMGVATYLDVNLTTFARISDIICDDGGPSPEKVAISASPHPRFKEVDKTEGKY